MYHELDGSGGGTDDFQNHIIKSLNKQASFLKVLQRMDQLIITKKRCISNIAPKDTYKNV
jgi:hypothetical protein